MSTRDVISLPENSEIDVKEDLAKEGDTEVVCKESSAIVTESSTLAPPEETSQDDLNLATREGSNLQGSQRLLKFAATSSSGLSLSPQFGPEKTRQKSLLSISRYFQARKSDVNEAVASFPVECFPVTKINKKK